MEIFEKLSPFMLRSGIIEVGRDRLKQVAHKLAFLLVTEDLSSNSLQELLETFDCPIFRYLTMADVAKYFNYQGTKVLGFRRNELSAQVMKALKGYGVTRGAKIPSHPNVAILGASGIGRHHANWWRLEGARVAAFLGSNPESIAKTTDTLKTMFSFDGRGYCDLEELLTTEKPDIVDVCLPPQMHYNAVKNALVAGCHVLCEKPFVYDDGKSPEELLEQARELTLLAEEKQLSLGICTQYVVAADEIRRLWLEEHTGEHITSFEGRLISPTRNRPPNAKWTWIDLAPHMLGVAQVLSGCGEIDYDNVKTTFEGHLAEVTFPCKCRDGRILDCKITTFHRDEEPKNVRQIVLNGELYDVGGRLDENKVFQMDIQTPSGIVEKPDMMRLLIRNYLHGCLKVPGRMARQNLEWMLKIIEIAEGK
ncbi:MAG: Gfo/Idh/MocA family oxidoreductase [Lentisphaeria bacterium]|nr:Gfo/Idh/MocA family oxidoreductase [Lentisphaeria bacterium]